MSKILLGVVGILFMACSFLYWQNSRLAEINQAFELRDKEQKAASAKIPCGIVAIRLKNRRHRLSSGGDISFETLLPLFFFPFPAVFTCLAVC